MFLKYLKEYAIMTLGLAVFVFGWTAFLNPHEITGGGIAGLASVIHYGIDSIPVSYAKFAIDILLLGFIILGKGFGVKTIYCVAMSFVLFQFMPMIPGLTSISAGITDNLINALIGGAMSGIGIAIIITQGGSTGGTDIIALSINKYKNISPGRSTNIRTFRPDVSISCAIPSSSCRFCWSTTKPWPTSSTDSWRSSPSPTP